MKPIVWAVSHSEFRFDQLVDQQKNIIIIIIFKMYLIFNSLSFFRQIKKKSLFQHLIIFSVLIVK